MTAVAFDAARDVTFFSDRPDSWLSLPAGHFAIFFPDDAHAPLAGRGTLKKAIVKIAIDWVQSYRCEPIVVARDRQHAILFNGQRREEQTER